jgi:putative heme-binding domain-containing protein
LTAARLASGRAGLTGSLISLADDSEIRVRFHAALALGDIKDDRAPIALARIAARDVEDPWVRLAVLSGLRDSADPFLRVLLDSHPQWLSRPTSAQARLLAQTAAILGARDRPEELRGIAERLAPGPEGSADPGRIALLAGLADGRMRAGKAPRDLLTNRTPEWRDSARAIETLLDRARRVAESDGPAESREQALQALAPFRPDLISALIPALLRPDQPPAVQAAAARALAGADSPALASQILSRWAELELSTRRAVLAAVIGSPTLVPSLLDALAAGTIGPLELSAMDRDTLRNLHDPALRQRAVTLLGKLTPSSDRTAILTAFQPALQLTGDAQRGANLFAQNCQTCHQRQGQGKLVGPDLSGIGGRPASTLLTDILDPNREVAPDYVSYIVVTRRGQVLSGLLVEETATSLKLRRADGIEDTVLRSEVEELRSSGRSLMPEGLEQSLGGVQGIADLLTYLRQL